MFVCCGPGASACDRPPGRLASARRLNGYLLTSLSGVNALAPGVDERDVLAAPGLDVAGREDVERLGDVDPAGL